MDEQTDNSFIKIKQQHRRNAIQNEDLVKSRLLLIDKNTKEKTLLENFQIIDTESVSVKILLLDTPTQKIKKELLPIITNK
jgi:hypothetical protein